LTTELYKIKSYLI